MSNVPVLVQILYCILVRCVVRTQNRNGLRAQGTFRTVHLYLFRTGGPTREGTPQNVPSYVVITKQVLRTLCLYSICFNRYYGQKFMFTRQPFLPAFQRYVIHHVRTAICTPYDSTNNRAKNVLLHDGRHVNSNNSTINHSNDSKLTPHAYYNVIKRTV
jgi:hypothetical protein